MYFTVKFRKSFLMKVVFLLCCVSLLWLHLGIFFINGTIEDEFSDSNIELIKPSNMSAKEIADIIAKENQEQVIWNTQQHRWPPNNISEPWPNGVVIVIQVHNRISYLRKLLESLSRSLWIEKALLVFSHDIYSDQLNTLIQSIPFSPVMQIFFPYSLQLYPSTFPGDSPLDCARNIPKQKAMAIGCINAEWPDLYGHYREARYSQTKHHWWWKVNFVFGKLRVLQNYYGPVVFLEEDHYVGDDFLHMLWLQHNLLAGGLDCPFCNVVRIISLGSYPKQFNHKIDSAKAEVLPWVSSKHNMGMAFNRSTWYEFYQCAEMFCTVDDYNWDWSLFHVSQKCLPKIVQHTDNEKSKFVLGALVLKAPRVFHIGECGVHHRKSSCASDTSILKKAENSFEAARKSGTLFPDRLVVKNLLGSKSLKVKKGNGGWGDLRDKQLCLLLSFNPKI